MEILFQIEGLKCPVFEERDDSIAITPFEKALVTKMRFQLAMCEDTLGLIWGRSQSRINAYIHEWAPLWGRAGRDLSLLDVDEDYIELELPAVFRDQGLAKHGAQVDGKDFLIETPRTHTAITRACWSDKSEASAARCCSWNLGSGLAFEHTPLFMGRAPENALVKIWRRALRKIPLGRLILADRGFHGDAFLYPNFNAHVTPHFLSGRSQFTVGELISDRRTCELRYTAETNFSRVTQTSGLKDVVTRGFFTIMDDMNDWAHAHINLQAPMQTPGNLPAGFFA